jgi:hypothetical protein
MATYNVKGPDGKLHEFQGPAGMPGDLVNMLANDYFHEDIAPAPAPAPKAETGFIPSVIRGGRGLSSLLGDVAPAMAAKALGYDDYAKKQMQEAAAYQKETEEMAIIRKAIPEDFEKKKEKDKDAGIVTMDLAIIDGWPYNLS